MVSEFFTQVFFITLAGFAPFLGVQKPDMALTMADDRSVTMQEVSRLLPAEKRSKPAPSKKTDSLGVNISSTAAIVVDAKSGLVLWQKNPRKPLPIASLTKLMSLQVFLDHAPSLDKEEELKPDENDLNGAKLREPTGTKIQVRHLFGSSLVGSANNTTLSLARSTGLSDEQFVTFMNEKAAAWNLKETHFIEPTGLNEKNVASVTDYARIALEAFEKPMIRELADEKVYSFDIVSNGSHHDVKTTNKIFDTYLKVLGSKTGFTYEAGYCLATLVTDEQGHELLIITLGSDSDEGRIQDTKALASWTFKHFSWSY